MQEAYGGTFMLKLFMVFFVIYVAFIGVALNFAKIYRVKNNVINILEQNQYSNDRQDSKAVVHEKLGEYLGNGLYGYRDSQLTNYNKYCKSKASDPSDVDEDLYRDFGICVIRKKEEDKSYYSVTVYYVIDFPILEVVDIPITASGETSIINYE